MSVREGGDPGRPVSGPSRSSRFGHRPSLGLLPALFRGRLPFLLPVIALVGIAGCTALGSEEEALLRGDEAFARGDDQQALAEYRLAVRQGADDPETLLRAAHAFASSGRVAEAREHYLRAVELDPDLTNQAVSSLVQAARDANSAGNPIRAAAALELAMEIKPGVTVEELSLPLARHFGRTGQHAEALPFYQKALAALDGEPDPDLVYEMALSYEQIDDCERAILHFDEIRDGLPEARQDQLDWHVGSCAYRLARELRRGHYVDWADEEDEDEGLLAGADEDGEEIADLPAGELPEGEVDPEELDTPETDPVDPTDVEPLDVDPEESAWEQTFIDLPGEDEDEREARIEDAVEYLLRVVELGEPRNLLAQAYFELGELYVELGECSRAVNAFQDLQSPDLTASGGLVQRAQDWVDEIRFGDGCPPPSDG